MKSVELEAVPDVLIRAFKFAEILDVFLASASSSAGMWKGDMAA